MTSPYIGNPEDIQAAVDLMGAGQGGLEADLRNVVHVKSDMEQAVQSPGVGQAISNSLQQAWTDGTALANKVQDVINALHQAGFDIHAQDLEGQARINAAGVHAGQTVNTGVAPGLNLNI